MAMWDVAITLHSNFVNSGQDNLIHTHVQKQLINGLLQAFCPPQVIRLSLLYTFGAFYEKTKLQIGTINKICWKSTWRSGG